MFALRPRLFVLPSLSARTFSSTARSAYANISIIGNLGATPEIEVTSTGTEVVRFSLATSYGPKDNRQTSWWRVGSFMVDGPRRQLLTSLPKGSLLHIEGEPRMRKYQDSDGKIVNRLDINAHHFDILSRRRPSDSETQSELE